MPISLGSGAEFRFVVEHDGETYSEFTSAAMSSGSCFSVGVISSSYPIGEYTMDITFGGNAWLGASTANVAFTIDGAPTTIALERDHTDPAFAGIATPFTATVSDPIPGHTHGGTVALLVNGDQVATADLDGTTADFEVVLPGGSAEVTAVYSGDDHHQAVTSAPVVVAVNQLDAIIAVTVTPSTVHLGESSTLAATVTPTPPASSGLYSTSALASAVALPVATGSVTFFVDGAPVGTVALVGGAASLPHVLASVGGHAVTASYSGSTDVAAVSAGAIGSAADVTVLEAIAVPAPSPPQAAPIVEAPTPPVSGSVTAGPVAADPQDVRPAAELAHTGSDARTLFSLAAVLLLAGAGLSLARPRSRRTG